jgi:hypothetical protein
MYYCKHSKEQLTDKDDEKCFRCWIGLPMCVSLRYENREDCLAENAVEDLECVFGGVAMRWGEKEKGE